MVWCGGVDDIMKGGGGGVVEYTGYVFYVRKG